MNATTRSVTVLVTNEGVAGGGRWGKLDDEEVRTPLEEAALRSGDTHVCADAIAMTDLGDKTV